MKFNDLPLLLKPYRVSEITGMTKRRLIDLVRNGDLEVIYTKGRRQPLYKRESVRIFLKLEGNEELRR